jgi:hypothetical protein
VTEPAAEVATEYTEVSGKKTLIVRSKAAKALSTTPAKGVTFAGSAVLETSFLRFALHAPLLDGRRALQPAMQIANEIVRRFDADRKSQ